MLMLSPQDCKPKVSQVRRSWFSPLGFVWGIPRSGTPKPVTCILGSTRFEVTRAPTVSMTVTRWKPPETIMPKRGNAALSRVPAAGSDPFESMESRRRRLLPCVPPAPPSLPGSTATEHTNREPSLASSSHAIATIPKRNSFRRKAKARTWWD